MTVSVIIPAYNRAGTIRRCVESALLQGIDELEIIVVDDGSTDDTLEEIRKIRDPRVRCISLWGNRGAQYARIQGIRNTRGKYVVFLDSDDELLPDSINQRIKTLKESGHEAALVYGDVIIHGRRDKLVRFKRLSGHCYKYLLKEMSLCPYSAMMIPRECFDVAGYPDDDFPSWQDDDMVLTIGRHYPILHCGCPVAVMHLAGNSISRNKCNVYIGCNKMIEKYRDEILNHHGRLLLFLWEIRKRRSYLVSEYHRLSTASDSNPLSVFLKKAVMATTIIILTLVLKTYFDNIYG